MSYMCFSLTWLPFDVQVPNCEKDSNPFGGERIDFWINQEIINCNNSAQDSNNTGLYNFGSIFDRKTLHQLSTLCGVTTVCDDLKPEVNLDQFWKKIVTKNRTKDFCERFSSLVHKDSQCPFSTRFDVQEYLYTARLGPQNDGTVDDENLCVDRFGRKYPPPVGLGGKCVAFQHEFKKKNKTITEFFMPIDKRDMIQRIAQYPYDHEIRDNSTTFNRILPSTKKLAFNESNCLNLHHMTADGSMEMFFHCVYDPKESHLFFAPDPTYFECPRNEHVTLYSDPSRNKIKINTYTTRPISEKFFEFNDDCYISVLFTPMLHGKKKYWNNTNVPFEMDMTLMGKTKDNCPTKHFIGKGSSNFYETMIKAMEDTCPWDQSVSYTICFELSAKEIMKNWGQLYLKLINLFFFDQCHYQSPTSKYGCYIIVDPKVKKAFRLPPKWVQKLENNELIISPKVDWSKKGISSAFVYFTAELKKECLEKLYQMGKSPIPGFTYENVTNYFAFNTKSFVAKCEKTYCDIPPSGDWTEPIWITEMEELNHKNRLNCSVGIQYNSVADVKTKSPWTFFCSVELSVYFEHGQRLRKYTFSNNLTTFLASSKEVTPEHCWTSDEFSVKMNDNTDKQDVTSCYHDGKTYKCCCRASKEPCNIAAIIDRYQEIAQIDKSERKRQIEHGCDFKTQVSTTTSETCSKDFVRNNLEMRCYGVFRIPTTAINNRAKPTLEKENCYWPHPQYHDEYSIFCSNQFFDNDDNNIVVGKCITSFINDFTSKSNSTKEKKFDRTLILCCNTGVYPNKRESILSRSFVLL